MLQSNPGCVCVCLYVCVCVCLCHLYSQTDWPILMKLYTNDLEYILECHLSWFLKFRIGWRHSGHFLHLRVAALSRSQYWSDFLQILIQEAHNSFIVWYWKSARSVNNFRSKKRTAFESHRWFGFRARLGGHGFESRRGQIFFFVILNDFSYEISKNRWNDWIYYNTLVFLFLIETKGTLITAMLDFRHF